VLASRSEQENQLLMRKLEPLRREGGEVRFVGVHLRGLVAGLSEPVGVVIINATEWTKNEVLELVALREGGYRGPVLVMTKTIPTAAAVALQEMTNIVLLSKPFEPKNLLGIVRKMLNAKSVIQQIYPRYKTDQDAELEPLGKNGRYRSRVCNLSKGGAYVELDSAAAVQVGDLVRLKLELAELNRIYTMSGRIVWTKRDKDPASQNLGGLAVGVEFVGPGDVQKSLIRSY
jgi:Tfp pilus assembly protein PilZ